MDGLVQWLRAQLDKEAALAEAAGGDSWWWQEHLSETVAVYDSKGDAVVYDEGRPTPEQQEHIATHDPARVLREIAAKRQLLDDYTVAARIRGEAVKRIMTAGDHLDSKDLEALDRAQREAAILEGPVKLAALPFNDRPGYCEEWRP